MNKTIKTLASGGLCLGLTLLSACSQAITPAATSLEGLQFAQLSPGAQNLVQEAQQQGQKNITVLDAGNGQKTTASFSVALKFNATESHFGTKASVSGIPKSSDANKVEVYLLELSSAPSGAIGVGAIKHNAVLAKNLVGGIPQTQTFVFTNVPANAAGNKYYVAARLIYDQTTPTVYTLNLIKPASTSLSLASGVGGPIVATNNGGTGNSGGVFVDPHYQIAAGDTSQLTMSMTLDDEKGAQLDSKVTVTEGATGIGGINVS